MQEKSFTNYQLGIKLNSYIDEKCNVWFQAKQVAQILGYKNTEHAIKRHVSENHKRTFLFVPRLKRAVNKMILEENIVYLSMKPVFTN